MFFKIDVCEFFPFSKVLFFLIDTVTTVQFLSASVFGAIMISRIVSALQARNETCLNDSNTATKSAVDNTRIQVTKMLIANTVVNFICLTPLMLHSIGHMIRFTTGVRIPFGNILLVSKVMAMLNSSINPVVYGIANRRYRDAFVKAFRCRGKQHIVSDKSVSYSTKI